MADHLVGFQLFVRNAPGQPPLAVTLDLGLRPLVPQQRRPWACRISTRLHRPSRDGLIVDRTEIETLGTVADQLLSTLIETADNVWVGMYTTGGVRTWLFYAAAPEPVAAAARAVVAGRPSYPAEVRTEADPNWSGYLSIYPTAAEQDHIRLHKVISADKVRARAMTAGTLRALQQGGDDPARERPVDYGFSFPTAASRAAFVGRVTPGDGFRVSWPSDVTSPGRTIPAGDVFTITVTRNGRAQAGSILPVEDWLISQARQAGGTYDGWGCLVPRFRQTSHQLPTASG